MKKALIVLFTILAGFNSSYCQSHKINIPEFKNINPGDHYSSASLPATYTETFDLLISFYTYSNWIAFNKRELVLAHNGRGWYKIQIDAGIIFRDTTNTTIEIIKINNNTGDNIYNILKENHLFDMKDGRLLKIPSCTAQIYDGIEYEFEVFADKKYKKLYFYEPEYYEEQCPSVSERKQIINCIKTFEKYLGN